MVPGVAPEEPVQFTYGFIQDADELYGPDLVDKARAGLKCVHPDRWPRFAAYLRDLLASDASDAYLEDLFKQGYADYYIRGPGAMRYLFAMALRILETETPAT